MIFDKAPQKLKLVSPDIDTYTATVRRIDEQAKEQSAKGLAVAKKLAGATLDDKQARIDRTLSGDMETNFDLITEQTAIRSKQRNLEEAAEFASRQLAAAKSVALAKLCESQKPVEKALMNEFLTHLGKAAEVFDELRTHQEELIYLGGLRGIYLNLPTFLDHGPNGDVAFYFQQCKDAGFIGSVPAVLRKAAVR